MWRGMVRCVVRGAAGQGSRRNPWKACSRRMSGCTLVLTGILSPLTLQAWGMRPFELLMVGDSMEVRRGWVVLLHRTGWHEMARELLCGAWAAVLPGTLCSTQHVPVRGCPAGH